MKRLPVLLAALLLMALTACERVTLRSSHQPDGARWAYADSLVSAFTIDSAAGPQRVRLSLSLTDDYPYRNLYLRLRLVPPRGPVQTATPELVLQDPYGTWHAERTWGGAYELSTVLNDSATFAPGPWRLVVQQFTRADTLVGVRSVSLEIRPRD